MTSSLDHEKAITIATSLLKHESPQIIKILKDLLTFIPNPNHVKDILEAAVIRLIYTSPQSALWLFHHAEVVEPEIQVREIIAQELTQKLLALGYTLKDFRFTADYDLEISDDAKRSLFSHQTETIDEPVLTLIHSLLVI